jgi:hypothetical protein
VGVFSPRIEARTWPLQTKTGTAPRGSESGIEGGDIFVCSSPRYDGAAQAAAVKLAASDQKTQNQAMRLADYFLPVETVLLFVSCNVSIFKEPPMEWTTPQHEEIDLNCEISSYANAEL